MFSEEFATDRIDPRGRERDEVLWLRALLDFGLRALPVVVRHDRRHLLEVQHELDHRDGGNDEPPILLERGTKLHGDCLSTTSSSDARFTPVADDVERAPLHLLVDAADVLAEDADHQELHAEEERDEHDRASSSRARSRLKHEVRDDALTPHRATLSDADEHAEVRREAQRQDAERRDAVEREREHLAQRILRLAGEARAARS